MRDVRRIRTGESHTYDPFGISGLNFLFEYPTVARPMPRRRFTEVGFVAASADSGASGAELLLDVGIFEAGMEEPEEDGSPSPGEDFSGASTLIHEVWTGRTGPRADDDCLRVLDEKSRPCRGSTFI